MTDDRSDDPTVQPAETPDEAPAEADPEALEQFREALTMALYVSLSLLAVLIALPVGHEDNRVQAGLTVMVTALGLVLAHHLAFRMSTRLVNGGLLTSQSVHALKAQALGGLPVAVIAAVPLFVLGETTGELVAEVVLLAFVALVGYRSARFTSNAGRSVLYVGLIVLAVAGVLLVKLLVGH
jgi:FtsH-binding integral membrane protein